VYTLTYTKSDNNYMSTVAWCKTSSNFCAPPSTKFWRRHWCCELQEATRKLSFKVTLTNLRLALLT